MKILVIGGGVAGPTFALFCNKLGVNADVTIIEKAPEFKNIGYGISLWGNGRKILDKLDVIKNLDDKEGYEIPWDAFETPTHKFLRTFYFDVFRKFGPTVTITRAAMQKALVDQVKNINVEIRLGTIAKIIENKPQSVLVEFSDGTRESFDLVVAADGVHSAAREEVFGKGFAKLYKTKSWVFWSPANTSSANGVVGILGSGKAVMKFPLSDKAFIMLGVKHSKIKKEQGSDKKAYLHELFKEFGSFVHNAIDGMENPDSILQTDLSQVVMKEWYKNRVVLIGDAQHALSPATGMGASLALEDAFVLADELSKNNIDIALNKFAKRRDPRMKIIKRLSNRLHEWVFASGTKAFIRDTFMTIVPTDYFFGGFKRLISEEI